MKPESDPDVSGQEKAPEAAPPKEDKRTRDELRRDLHQEIARKETLQKQLKDMCERLAVEVHYREEQCAAEVVAVLAKHRCKATFSVTSN
jgi:hypothetical protein